jgi:CheY-like chemotaxis protein
MTAHAMQGDYEKSMVAGMNAHVTKPIDVEELYRTYYKWAEVGLQTRPSEPLR